MKNISPKQTRISKQLEQYGNAVKSSYLSSIHVLSSEDYPDRLVHFSHSLREVIDLLTKKSKPRDDKTHYLSKELRIKFLKNTFDPLGDNHSYDEYCKQLATYYGDLSSVSHHEKISTDQECQKNLNDVGSILELLTQPISEIMDIADEILSQNPSEKNAIELQKYLFLHATQSHLVQELSDDWLPFLQNTDFFNNPAQAINQDGQKRSRYWMPSDYLRKCTTTFPNNVTTIILTCKFVHEDHRNWMIYFDFLECVVKLPIEYIKKIAEKIISENWHDFISVNGFAEKYASVMEKLYMAGEYELAKQFALNLWAPKNESYQIKPMFDYYSFEQILLKIIPKFVKKNHTIIIELLIILLNQSLQEREKSLITLIPSIEDHSQNTTFQDITRFFVFHLRDCLDYVGENNIDKLKSIMSLLSNQTSDIFRRIELYVYCQFPNEFINNIPEALETNFDKKYVHEYYNLIKKTFELIPKDSQKNIVELIDRGVNKEMFEMWEDSAGKSKAVKYEEEWKLKKFEPIFKYLDQKHRSEYAVLLEKFGEPEHPDFHIFQKGITIGGSNTNSKLFYEKSIEDVFNIVKNYEMNSNEINNEDSTLMSFETFVEANCFECSEKCLELENSKDYVLNSFFSGLEKAVKNNQECVWKNILILSEHVLKFANNEDYISQSFDPVFSVMYLINRGLNNNIIPFELKEKIWNTLKIITFIGDNHSSPNEIDHYPDELMIDSSSFSGLSYRIMCDYVVWCFENNKERNIPSEVKDIFNNYLNNSTLYSISRHKIFGMYFDSFYFLDETWTKNMLTKLFTGKNLKIAFWKGFLVRSKPTKVNYDVLYYLYREFSKTQIIPSKHPVHKKTVELITLAFFNNVPKYDELFSEFYNNADDESISSCGDYINFLLRNGEKSEKYADKIEMLWNVEKFQDFCSLEEWFRNTPLTKEKSIKYLLKYVKNSNKKFHSIYFPLESLKDYLVDFPCDVADCIINFLDKLKINHISTEPIYTITKDLLVSHDSDIEHKCKIIKNKMMSLGHIEFRDL